MKMELLVDSTPFWTRLRQDLQAARGRALVQTFTFEGDRVGAALGRALRRSPATHRHLLVDGYSLLYHNDRWIAGPAWFDRGLRQEVLRTHGWVRRLRRSGVGVSFGNPVGPSPARLVRRNHKKLIIVDDVTYLGGINFSEHNFAWHDMMLRIESAALADCLAADFAASRSGRPQPMDRTVGALRLLSLNGRGNARGMTPVLDGVEAARHTIDVQSAYLSHPFTDHLAAASRRGVRVRILTPARNNKGNLARHLLQTAAAHGFEVFRHPGMSHLKAMLVDDLLLVAGSSNFDFMSYHILEELVVLTRDAAIVNTYRTAVWGPDLAASHPAIPQRSLGTRLGHASIKAGARIASFLAHP
jgi:cardiolipin synthase